MVEMKYNDREIGGHLKKCSKIGGLAKRMGKAMDELAKRNETKD